MGVLFCKWTNLKLRRLATNRSTGCIAVCSQIETTDHLSKAGKRCGKMIIGLVAQSVTAVQVSDVRVSSTISHGGPYDGQQSVAMNVAVASASPNKSAPTSSRYAVQLRTRFANASR